LLFVIYCYSSWRRNHWNCMTDDWHLHPNMTKSAHVIVPLF
jgi:hypothetical protein